MNIILFGFKKCGKTYFGMKLAQRLHKDFIDSDHLVEELYTAQYHETLSYRDIAQKRGFDFFCELEKQAVSLLVQKKQCVISLGGGVMLNSENVARLQEAGVLVHLKPSKMTLKIRMLSEDIPLYFDPIHPEKSFDTLYAARMPLYEKVPAHQINPDNKSEEEVLKELSDLAKKNKAHP